MAKYASKVVEQAKSWLGKNVADGSHKMIIDIYNSQKPLPSGYKVKYTDAWCATFASAVAVKLGYTDIIPTECSCGRMIEKFKNIGCWKEDESITPKAGWFIFYDWEDNGVGNNKGVSDHVGIIEKVYGGEITVIEGNFSTKSIVARRKLKVNGRYIRGYGAPKYDKEGSISTTTSSTISKDNSNKKIETVKNSKETYRKQFIKDVQKAIGAKIDGIAGNETYSKTITVSRYKNNKHAVVKPIQVYLNNLGYNCGTEDGVAGVKFDKAVKKYQKDHGCIVDGEVTKQNRTWGKMLGILK